MRIGRLCGALLISLIVAAVLGSAASAVPSPPAQAAASAGAARVSAEITIRHRGPDRPSSVTIRLQPPDAARDGELLFSIFQAGGSANHRRVLEPSARGVYRTELPFPPSGRWGYYVRFGPGQAGYVSAGIVDLTSEAAIVDSFTTVFHSSLARAPRYVQPLGYATFGVIAGLALAGIWAILARLRDRALRLGPG